MRRKRMRKVTRKWTIATVVLIGLIAGVAGCLPHRYRRLFDPGDTMEETARILVHDFKFGMRARRKAIQHGDAILPLIQRESEDFTLLDGRNSFWIADVLGAIQTDRCHAILSDLYSRTDATTRLTGAIGLAQHGALPDAVGEEAFLVKTVRADLGQTETQLATIALGRTETQLAIIALGWTKDRKALPCLLDLLKQRPMAYWHHAYACEALARIGSADAIPVLRDCLTADEFYALPDAFRTLIALGDRQAVPLAIARVTPEIRDSNGSFVIDELKCVTGKSYGYDQARWQKWWDAVEATWQIPKEFTKPWDEQEKRY
jgi:hypothetical protein